MADVNSLVACIFVSLKSSQWMMAGCRHANPNHRYHMSVSRCHGPKFQAPFGGFAKPPADGNFAALAEGQYGHGFLEIGCEFRGRDDGEHDKRRGGSVHG